MGTLYGSFFLFMVAAWVWQTPLPQLAELTFRTLFRSSEAILSEPPEEKGGQARPRLFHML
jgi:hypothetical protein